MNTLFLPAEAPASVEQAAAIIKRGGLLGIPTETVYGLGANGLDPEAVLKIFIAKGRPQDNPLILPVASPEQVPDFCARVPEQAKALMDRFWPGPLTIILPARDLVPRRTTAGLSTVGVRCPATEVTRRVIEAAGVPIAAPSANLSGKPSPTTAAHVLHDMDGRIDAVLDADPCDVGVESTIVDLSGDRPRLLRPGGIGPEALREVLGDLEIDPAVLGELPPDAVVRAPGMKYTHYTPQAEVVIVTGSPAEASSYVNRRLDSASRILCFQEEADLYPEDLRYVYGEAAKPETLARGLFAALRDLDSPEIHTIYARCPEGGGVGYAVANRLKKAAGFHIVKGAEEP